jgi:hypothetical protein
MRDFLPLEPPQANGSAPAGVNQLAGCCNKDLMSQSGIRFKDRGIHQLKGLPERWRLYRVETLRGPARVDTGFAIGSLRLQLPRVRMANGWALRKFGGESLTRARRLTPAPHGRDIFGNL